MTRLSNAARSTVTTTTTWVFKKEHLHVLTLVFLDSRHERIFISLHNDSNTVDCRLATGTRIPGGATVESTVSVTPGPRSRHRDRHDNTHFGDLGDGSEKWTAIDLRLSDFRRHRLLRGPRDCDPQKIP